MPRDKSRSWLQVAALFGDFADRFLGDFGDVVEV
jgi:hypothetical protein